MNSLALTDPMSGAVSGSPPEPPAATGEAGSPGTNFGWENAAAQFNSGTATNFGPVVGGGANVLGAVQTPRRIKLPAGAMNMPTSGSFFAMIPFWVDPNSAMASSRNMVLASVDGLSSTNGSGGFAIWMSPFVAAGGVAQGQISIMKRLSGGAYSFLGGSTQANSICTGITFVPGEHYVLFIGRNGTVPTVKLVQVSSDVLYALADRQQKNTPLVAVQTFTGAETGTITANQPLFDTLGSAGTASSGDWSGFAGAVADAAFVTGGFPSDAQLQQIANGAMKISDIPANVAGATVRYHNKLDYSARSGTALAPAIDPNSLGNCTLQGSNHTGYAPIRQGGVGITLERLPPGFTFAIKRGATTGRVLAAGKCTIAGVPIQMRLEDDKGAPLAGWDWRTVNPSSSIGDFIVSIDGVPKATRPFPAVRLGTSSEHYVRGGSPCQLGLKIFSIHQSEGNALATVNWTAADGSHNSGVPAQGGMSIDPVSTLPGGGNWLARTDSVSYSGSSAASGPDLSTLPATRHVPSKAVVGDGIVSEFNRFYPSAGCGLSLFCGGKSGHAIYATVYDAISFTQNLANHTGGASYSATLALSATTVKNKFGWSVAPNVGGWLNQIRPGTVSIVFAGGVTVVDNPNVKDSGQLTGNLYLSTDPGFTTPVGTVQYNGGTSGASITLTGLPGGTGAGVPAMTWTVKQITSTTSYAAPAGWTNGAAVGAYSIKDWLLEMLGPHLKYGFSAVDAIPGASNTGDASTVQNFCDIYGQQLDLHRQWFWGLLTAANPNLETELQNPLYILTPKFRDTSSTTYNQVAFMRLACLKMDKDSGDANSRSWIWTGGQDYDNQVDANAGPHPAWRFDGSARVGRHKGRTLAAFAANDKTIQQGPKFGTPVWNGTNQFRIPATLQAGRSLTVTGTYNFSENGADGTFTQSAGNSAALDLWYVNNTLADNSTNYVASIEAGGQAVIVQKVSGNFAGTETVKYANPQVGGTPPTTDNVITPPVSLLYDDYGDTGGYEPGRLAEPML